MKYKYFLEKLLIDFSDYHLIHDEKSYKQFKKNKKSILYFIIWSETLDIFSWGTMSNGSDRIRLFVFFKLFI